MASDDSTEEKTKMSAVTLLNNAKDLYAASLYGLRETHDICVSSEFFKPETILEMDTCTIDFRTHGFQTVTFAKMVSNQWLDSVISFYKNISLSDHDSIVETLKLLGGQAKELGIVHKVIAAWSRNLAERFHKACEDINNEATFCKEQFKKKLDEAREDLERAKEQFETAKANHDAAVANERKWAIGTISFSWNLVGLIVGSIGLIIAGKATASLEAAETAAREGLRDAVEAFNSAEANEKKAEMIASKAGELVVCLEALETVMVIVGTFWTMQSDIFMTQGQKMKTNETHYSKALLEKAISKKDIETWEEAKSDFEGYVNVMSVILNSLNFTTDAEPLPTQEFKLDLLDFTMTLPSTIDVEKIMAGGE